jgi:hypothetical protein
MAPTWGDSMPQSCWDPTDGSYLTL